MDTLIGHVLHRYFRPGSNLILSTMLIIGPKDVVVGNENGFEIADTHLR